MPTATCYAQVSTQLSFVFPGLQTTAGRDSSHAFLGKRDSLSYKSNKRSVNCNNELVHVYGTGGRL